MKFIKVLLLALCLLALVPQLAAAQDNNSNNRFRRNDGAIPNSYIVVFNDDVPARRVAAFASQLAREHGGKVGFTYQYALRGFSVEMSEEQAVALSRNPQIAYVEEDILVEGAAVQTNPTWALDRIDQRNLPLDTNYSYANNGAGVNVYVIDGGIRYTHQEFGGRAASAYDYAGGAGIDCNGHGTHVAGIIGGSTYGVAKGAKLWSVRVLDCANQGALARIIAGVDWLMANHVKPAVANMSFISVASSTTTSTLDTAVRSLVTAGITTVVAAGNNNGDAAFRTPSRVTEAITVAATDQNDTKLPLSNFGAGVDLFAPGFEITSANSASDTSIANKSGSSAAAPFVAGTAARYLSGNPQASPDSVSKAITSNATVGKVINAGAGTPNLLLYKPNGKIAFSSYRDGQFEIYSINPDGTEEARLTTHDYSDDMWPEYSPDGRKIAFTSGRGDDLYYQVYVMNADGTNVTRVTNSRTGHSVESAWSPDGSQIAFRTNRDAGDWEIYVINADGTNERRLTYSAGFDIDPAWSPDGTKIVFPTVRDSPYNIELYTMNADGSNPVNITNNLSGVGAHNDYYPAWSSTGAKIAFIFDGGNDPRSDQVFVMNADGSGRVNLSNNNHWEYNPSWSSDDSRIVFQSDQDDGKGELYIMNSDGSNRMRLTFNTGDGVDPSTACDYYPDWQVL
ncbi:MAG TPA: S8 family serine peptidase [Pyrinomonadaceae bacterium]|nr:S8 family serine peptidase [Pyrinomonadaceae bacterium]